MRGEQRGKDRDQDVDPEDDQADAGLAVAPQRAKRPCEEEQRSRNLAGGRTPWDLDRGAGDSRRWNRSDDAHACRTRGSRRT